jgi:hypothetical protein
MPVDSLPLVNITISVQDSELLNSNAVLTVCLIKPKYMSTFCGLFKELRPYASGCMMTDNL